MSLSIDAAFMTNDSEAAADYGIIALQSVPEPASLVRLPMGTIELAVDVPRRRLLVDGGIKRGRTLLSAHVRFVTRAGFATTDLVLRHDGGRSWGIYGYIQGFEVDLLVRSRGLVRRLAFQRIGSNVAIGYRQGIGLGIMSVAFSEPATAVARVHGDSGTSRARSSWRGRMRTRSSLIPGLIALAVAGVARGADGPDAEYPRKQIPVEIAGQYSNGEVKKLTVGGRSAYIVKPKGMVDPDRRWIWIFPFWLGINDGHGALHHRVYVERFLGAGFHVAGIDVGTSCGSPSAARLCQEFYNRLIAEFQLNRKARLVLQSNGGLIGYAWAFRNAENVDRIFGICPVTDFRTWPTLPVVMTAPAAGLGYDLSLPDLTRRMAEFNPVDNLAPLAKAGVKLLHIHGDKDELVPLGPNSGEVVTRYRAVGGDAVLVTLKGMGHGGKEFYESRDGINFLLGN